MKALIQFEPGSKGFAHHRAIICVHWISLAQMAGLQISAEFATARAPRQSAEAGTPPQFLLMAKITYAGAKEEAWLKQLPLPPGSTLAFSLQPSALPG